MRVGDQLFIGSTAISANYTRGLGFHGFVQASIHGNVSVELSSFTGVDWRILFAGIGPAIRNFLFVFPEEMKGILAALYEDFYELMSCMGRCEKKVAEEVARKACVWVECMHIQKYV